MVKYKPILICLMLVVLLTSCFNDSASESNEVLLNSIIADNSSETDSKQSFSFNSSLNVFYTNSTQVPLGNAMNINRDELISLKLQTNVSPDTSLDSDNIIMRIWILLDGSPIEFSINENNEFKMVNDISVIAFLDQYAEINFHVSKSIKLITIVCMYYPEDIPSRGVGSYSGEISYTIINTAHTEDSTPLNLSSDYYVDIPQKEENYGLDIGGLSVEENGNKVLEPHFYEDVMLSGNENLYIKFNSGKDKETPYYIVLLCNGTMVKAFNNNYSYKVNCQNGKRTFQYPVPSEFIPESGLHTFQAIVIPADVGEDLSSYSTPKTRVQIS